MTASPSRSRTRICLVAPVPPPYGGMSLQADKLLSLLAEEGYDVDVVATNPAPPKGFAWVQMVPALRTLVREGQYLRSLIKRISDRDVVHHFSASGLYFFAHSAPVLLFGKWWNKRVILNYRGGKAGEFLKNWAWCVVPLMRLATQVSVPSEFLQQVFEEYGLNSVLLPNIAQVEMFPWKRRSRFSPSLLVTRHLEPMYNIECLLRAFRKVRQTFSEATLSIAGDGSEATRLRDLVGQWQLPGVQFLGAVAHRDLPELYAAHDIYINSSSVDNFPGALVEAACSGLPIVTTGAGGIPWMIRNRERGMVVDLNDNEALAAGVIKIVENAELGCRLARNARNWAEQFSWRNVLPRLLAAYGIPVSAPAEVTETEMLAGQA